MRLVAAALAALFLPALAGCREPRKAASPPHQPVHKGVQRAPARPPRALTPDEKRCRALASARTDCRQRERKNYNKARWARVIMRACRRDLADPETRPHQLRLVACARQTDCKKQEVCYEKASKALREVHFRRAMKARGR